MNTSVPGRRARLRQLVLSRHAHPAARRSARRCSRSIRSAARSTTSPTIPAPREPRRGQLRALARRHRCALRRRAAAALGRSRAGRAAIRSRSARISSPSSTAWRWTSTPTSARPTWPTLDLYCDRVASAVGRLSVRVFGMARDAGLALAHHLGRALQLTNILRDLDEDAAIGRLYLPREALRDAGITSTDPATVLANPALGDACATVVGAGAPAFSRRRRDHGALAAPRGARAAHHGRGLSRHPRQAGRARLGAAAPAGAPFASCGFSASCCAISCDANSR